VKSLNPKIKKPLLLCSRRGLYFGRAFFSNCRIDQPLDYIDFDYSRTLGLFEKIAPLYESGASLREISKNLKVARDTIRRSLKEGGITIRPGWGAEDFPNERLRRFHFGIPPFGYYVRNGKLIEHPTEYITLRVIIKLRSEGKTLMAIAEALNDQGLRPRRASKWDHSSIRNILLRHKNVGDAPEGKTSSSNRTKGK
jgi:hypothetical protein